MIGRLVVGPLDAEVVLCGDGVGGVVRVRVVGAAAEARRAGITSEKPPEPVAKRAEDAEKDARRSQARLEIAEAIRNGADDAAIEALLATWLTRGVNLYPSRKMIFSDPLKAVRERTIRRPR